MKKNLIIFGLLIVAGYCCAQPGGDNPQGVTPHAKPLGLEWEAVQVQVSDKNQPDVLHQDQEATTVEDQSEKR